MFCDLVGSTALASGLDPEDLREIIAGYHRCAAELIGRFDGFVANYMGDGVLAYFGYPYAHEDNAEQAVRAGLALVEAVGQLPAPTPLRVRIGIATGVVVVGDLISAGEVQERGVIGGTPNLAARLQALATPNSVVIDVRTRALLGSFFELLDLGTVAAKGFADPVQAYRVLRPSIAVASRFEAFHQAALMPLVGRGEEVELLLRRWQQAVAGKGQVVLLSGEPGIGKSRITAALQEHLQDQPHVRVRSFCSPHHQESALHPTIAQLERAAGFEREDTAGIKLDKLAALLAPTGAPQEDVALLAELLSLLAVGHYPPLADLSPQQRKERTFQALLRQLEGLAREHPVLMVYEDAHWIDPTSRELLNLVVAKVAHLRMLLIITFRPEFQPPWLGQPHATGLTLNRLDQTTGATIVEQVAGDNALPDDVVREIVGRTDGVPLFIEELTKAVLEAGASNQLGRGVVSATPTPALAVPATLHASLMARLDYLGPAAKAVAQTGAAIGREFSYELLVAAAGCWSEAELKEPLRQLVEAGLLFRRGMPPQSTYLFKHALVQEAAYGTLLRRPRQELHAHIATVLEERWPDMVETQPELLAHHFTQASMTERAADYWKRAGERALKRSAIAEAICHVTKGIDLVRTLPQSRDRAERELHLQTMLGQACIARHGHGAPETAAAFARARALVEAVGDVSQQFPVLWGFWAVQFVRMALREQRELAGNILALAERHPRAERLCVAHRIAGATHEMMGELLVARRHLEQAVAVYDPERHGSTAFAFGQDLGVSALVHLVWVLWQLGYPDQAFRRRAEALALAERLGHKNSLGFALMCGAVAGAFGRDARSAAEYSTTLLKMAQEQGLVLWTAGATIIQGWAITCQGQRSAGRAVIERGLEEWTSVGAEWMQPFFLGLFAEACAASGEVQRGLSALEEAVAAVERTGQRWPEAELHRLRGQYLALLPGASRRDEVEAAFQLAIQAAQRQSAKSWELRAATSLARFWRDQGNHNAGCTVLAPVYTWFTEGFDTPDLRDARALLDELPR